MRVLLPATSLPDGQNVTKRGGEKVYLLQSSIKVHGSGNISCQEIKAQPSARFLVAKDGSSISAISQAPAGRVDGVASSLPYAVVV